MLGRISLVASGVALCVAIIYAAVCNPNAPDRPSYGSMRADDNRIWVTDYYCPFSEDKDCMEYNTTTRWDYVGSYGGRGWFSPSIPDEYMDSMPSYQEEGLGDIRIMSPTYP